MADACHAETVAFSEYLSWHSNQDALKYSFNGEYESGVVNLHTGNLLHSIENSTNP